MELKFDDYLYYDIVTVGLRFQRFACVLFLLIQPSPELYSQRKDLVPESKIIVE